MQASRTFLLVTVALVIPYGCSGAYLPPKCPDKCVCQSSELGALRLRCTSLDFLGKIRPKQILAIDALDLADLGLQHIDPKLSKLRNLKELNLSNNALSQLLVFPYLPKLMTLSLSANHLKQFTADNLPETLEYLDVSRNYISDIPKELINLSYLRHLVYEGNPVRCDCDSLSVRDKLLKSGVVLSKPITCQTPDKLYGRSIFDVSCAEVNPLDYWDQMQGDYPFANEGSGDGTVVEMSTVANTENEVESLGEQFIPSSKYGGKSAPLINEKNEGSGADEYTRTTTIAPDEDYDYESSGFAIGEYDSDVEPTAAPPPPHDSACIFDCSTDGPSTTTIDPFSDAQPGLIDGLKIILTDLSGRNDTDKKESIATEATIVPVIVSKEEAEVEKVDQEGSDKDIDVFDPNNIDKDELSRQRAAAKSEEEQPDQAVTYIVVAVLIVIMVCLVAYSVIKRRRQRPRKLNDEYKVPPEQNSQELKDISKKPTGQAGNLPEKIPLINGQNGKVGTDSGNGILERPMYRVSEGTSEAPPSPSSDVAFRNNGKDNDLLVPEAHRVTVHAKELTTPKTPLLVNRQRSDDGSIVTTPSNELMP